MKTINLNPYESYVIMVGLLLVSAFLFPCNKELKTNCNVDNPSSMEVVDLSSYQFTAGGMPSPKLPKNAPRGCFNYPHNSPYQDTQDTPSPQPQKVGQDKKQEHVAPPPPEPAIPDGYDRYSKKFNTDQTGWFIYLLKNKDNGHIYIQLFNETRVKTDPKDCYGGEILSYSSQHVENLFNYLNGPNGGPADVSFSVDFSEKDPKITIKKGNGVEWKCDISSDHSKKYVTF